MASTGARGDAQPIPLDVAGIEARLAELKKPEVWRRYQLKRLGRTIVARLLLAGTFSWVATSWIFHTGFWIVFVGGLLGTMIPIGTRDKRLKVSSLIWYVTRGKIRNELGSMGEIRIYLEQRSATL